MSVGNIIRDSFEKTNLLPLRLPNLTTNIQSCAASIQVSSGDKAEEITIFHARQLRLSSYRLSALVILLFSYEQRVRNNHQGTLFYEMQCMTL